MKEKIYTIPVTEAFNTPCECPMCILHKKLEEEYVEYMLGPSLMEPDGRTDTNEKGFCRPHFEALYNKQSNRLGLGLVLETHLMEQTSKIKKLYESKKEALKKDSEMSMAKSLASKLSSKDTDAEKFLKDLIRDLLDVEAKCSICSKLIYTMDRYTDVIIYLWSKEEDFRKLFKSKTGFCQIHFRKLLEGADKYLSIRERPLFLQELIEMQISNMERIQSEVSWFTKKFDYRNNEAPWGNSKDAIPRSIQKIVGNCNFK